MRQGEPTPPALFSLFIHLLIEELGSSSVGCSIDGNIVKSLSYADDIFLLYPSGFEAIIKDMQGIL